MKSIHNFLVLTLLLGAIITGLSQPSQPMSQIAAKAWADYKGDGLADPAPANLPQGFYRALGQ